MCGCASLQHLAVNKAADALSAGGSGYGTDDDPELIRDAAPFSLKLMEMLLAQAPRHAGLLTSLAGGFTQYAWAYVQQDADQLEDTDIESAFAACARALPPRAGLRVARTGFAAQGFRRGPGCTAAGCSQQARRQGCRGDLLDRGCLGRGDLDGQGFPRSHR
jgi:hypothetical protein